MIMATIIKTEKSPSEPMASPEMNNVKIEDDYLIESKETKITTKTVSNGIKQANNIFTMMTTRTPRRLLSNLISSHPDYFHDIRDSHAASTKAWECSVCSREFPTAGGLNAHMPAHSGTKQKCPVCSKEFPVGQQLNGHMLFHQTKACWKCTYCQNTFQDAKLLKSHMEEQHGHLKTNGVWNTPRPSHLLTLTEAKRKAEAIKANNSKIGKMDFIKIPLFPDAKKRKLVAKTEAKTEAEDNTAVKTENLSDASHQSPLPVEQRTTIFSEIPKKRKLVAKTEAEENMVVKIKNFSNSGHQSSLPVEQRATINIVEPVKIEADKNPENFAVKSEIDDDIVVLE